MLPEGRRGGLYNGVTGSGSSQGGLLTPASSQSAQCVWRKCTPPVHQSQTHIRITGVFGGSLRSDASGITANRISEIYTHRDCRQTGWRTPHVEGQNEQPRRDFVHSRIPPLIHHCQQFAPKCDIQKPVEDCFGTGRKQGTLVRKNEEQGVLLKGGKN